MRTTEDRYESQLALKDRMEGKPTPQPSPDELTIAQCAHRMNCAVSTAWKIFRDEEGVRLIVVPGRRKPMIRVPLAVLERVMRRSVNPPRRPGHA